jgi:hypothetical protein
MKTIFTKDYVDIILKPFIGKPLRMRTESEDKSYSIPFHLETSIDASFQIELSGLGIKFILKDNYYIKRDIRTLLTKAILETNLYPHTIDNLLQDEEGKVEDNIFQKIVTKYFDDNFHPQIAFTYYTMIKTLKVTNRGFVLNGIEFVISI